MGPYAVLAAFVVAALVLLAPVAIASKLLSPRKPNAIKELVYESGLETEGETWVQFKVQYYIYGLIFLVFDVEIIFLFPWALAYNQLDFFGFAAGLLFIFFLFDALVYAWRKDALEWL